MNTDIFCYEFCYEAHSLALTPPFLDHLKYQKMEGEGLENLTT